MYSYAHTGCVCKLHLHHKYSSYTVCATQIVLDYGNIMCIQFYYNYKGNVQYVYHTVWSSSLHLLHEVI